MHNSSLWKALLDARDRALERVASVSGFLILGFFPRDHEPTVN